mmetsp:Transcript_5327/g.11750  ORF Transcript_5327/g.11750 Transcript_5327/m.11750 type:complete len:276 (-) Transcript_5327:52-879(-)
MVRVDCSEYMEKHAVSRLIGAPPGYVGHEEGGQLTEAVRRRPYSVVLFDEVEKAHPDVLNALLQVLDDGRLTDGQGRTVDFANTVIFLTSNLGAHHLVPQDRSATSEFTADEWARAERAALGDVRLHFRPEFLNRLGEILVFKPLGAAAMTAIVRLAIHDLLEKPLAAKGIAFSADQAAIAAIARASVDAVYGARPVRRYVTRALATEVSRQILSGNVASGGKVELVETPDGSVGVQTAMTWNQFDGVSEVGVPRAPSDKVPRDLGAGHSRRLAA